MTATGIVSRQGTSGNWATVGRRRRRRGGRCLQRRQEKEQCSRVEVRVGTLNVGTMTGRGREIADMMERRKVDMLCVQETKWKGSKARNIGGGFKLFYHGVDGKRNIVGVILKEEYSKSVVEVKRVSDRVMIVKVEVEGMMINVISAYAPQVGCEMEEKERFWSELDDMVDGVPRKERLVIGADFNGHVGEGNRGDEEVMGRYGFKERHVEGQMVGDFAKRMEMAVVNTYFKKKEDHRVTYRSGGRCTQVDYVLCRRCNLKKIGDCKLLAGDSVARQHRMVVCRMVLEAKKKRRNEVQESIREKRLAKQKWDRQSDEKSRQEYKEMQQQVKRNVAKAKEKAYEELYKRLDTKEGEKELYRLARQRDRAGKDVLQVRAIKDREGNVLTSEESVLRRWREYFEQLMNKENHRERRLEDVELVKQDVDRISKEEVRAVIKRMKSGKSVGPDDIPVEAWRCLGEMAVEFLTRLFNTILEGERMPKEWRKSVLVPIFKNKGDVQTCSNYRGIKLISHTIKLWERVVEARLREEVTICEHQYGFMPRKSTTDALFALRMLVGKYREGQKELHCIFVDLKKAYDRVPREELWYCMRKSGVSEKYVRVVQDMYEDSVTAVKCAVGTTDWFRVKVGLHQGSALSPFLFAVVIGQVDGRAQNTGHSTASLQCAFGMQSQHHKRTKEETVGDREGGSDGEKVGEIFMNNIPPGLREVQELSIAIRTCSPLWDLAVVLEALSKLPFEPFLEVPLGFLTVKTVFLLAISSLKRFGDLHTISVSPSCLEFTPGMASVLLYPRPGYVPKVPSVVPRPVVLQAFYPPSF
ncbi:hypothetical protein C0J50_22292 [Silurus asotus]|uniref:Reverse transcriptase domain-containing protein n=1 Tax=Silurus asotus TaxID=30991 RepID=A0AAD5FIJ9_SILAS|nr:hypothetical protein C0J50_22292 [Silurus asotus]